MVCKFFKSLTFYCEAQANSNMKQLHQDPRYKHKHDHNRPHKNRVRDQPQDIIDQCWLVKIQSQANTSKRIIGLGNENEWVSVDSFTGQVFRMDRPIMHLCASLNYVSNSCK